MSGEQSADGTLQCEIPNCLTEYNVEPAKFPPGLVLNGCEDCREKYDARSVNPETDQ
jgi:hypothetical protein